MCSSDLLMIPIDPSTSLRAGGGERWLGRRRQNARQRAVPNGEKLAASADLAIVGDSHDALNPYSPPPSRLRLTLILRPPSRRWELLCYLSIFATSSQLHLSRAGSVQKKTLSSVFVNEDVLLMWLTCLIPYPRNSHVYRFVIF